MTNHKSSLLSEKTRNEIDEWAKRYPPEQRRSAVMTALHLVQEENGGWLTETLMDAVADHLSIPPIAVYEVASFYTMYNRKPVGKHIINVCTNISCMLNGAEDIVDHLKKRFSINFNETTSDGRFTLREVECLAACVKAPVCQIDKTYHEELTPEKIDKLINELESDHG